ncbi:MAG: ester cyclase [Anaerolineales bacterium]|jgi:predicted ester cyclase
MSTETNKAIVRRYLEEIVNNQRFDLIDEFFVDTVELHGVGPGIIGRTALEKYYDMFGAAFPDWHTAIDDMVAEGDKVVVRYTATSTHQGEFRGIPATGKPYLQKAIVIYLLTNGRIVEGWLQTDVLSMMQQLDLLPASQEN